MEREAQDQNQRLLTSSGVTAQRSELTLPTRQSALPPNSPRFLQRHVGNNGMQELESQNTQNGYFFELTLVENLALLEYLQPALKEGKISSEEHEEIKLALQIMRFPMSSVTINLNALHRSFEALRRLLFRFAPERIANILLNELLRQKSPAVDFKEKWANIQEFILYPTKLRKAIKSSLFYPLREPHVIGHLLALTPDQRAIVTNEVYQRLASSLTGKSFSVLQEEYGRLSNRVRENIEGYFNGFIAIHRGVHHYFRPEDQNKVEVDSKRAIDQLNQYYAELVHPEFPNVKNAGVTFVHPQMNQRLQLAKAYLEKRGTLKAATAGIKEIWGASLRENRNLRGDLSPHSFGISIDIDSQHNPNLNPFPALFSKLLNNNIAGEDFAPSLRDRKAKQIFGHELGWKQHSQPWEEWEKEVRKDVERLLKASTDIVRIFANTTELQKGLLTYLKQQGLRPLSISESALMEELCVEATGKEGQEKAQQALSMLRVWIYMLRLLPEVDLSRRELLSKFEPQAIPPSTRQMFEVFDLLHHIKSNNSTRQYGPALHLSEKSQAKLMLDRPTLTNPKPRYNSGSDMQSLTIDLDLLIRKRLEIWETEAEHYRVWRLAHEDATILVEAWRTFILSHKPDSEEKISSAAVPAPGMAAPLTAAHGFINLNSEFVTAMVVAGNLRWLGGSINMKDSMHFELHPEEVMVNGKPYRDLHNTFLETSKK